ncbi:extracellular solute-binding protein [Paenibacillus doosanensis]|uniref:extracellular solute-binding protein n=1 Tax=Paenibacillus doosanensis TaxID=1229154 RepID=UPI00217F5E9D|nr:extracellular solute-binding protein [Paenibacillus doosanensis]MCS7462828.1 extracellular solute-binding protein [Paenibacillus doosanensis]
MRLRFHRKSLAWGTAFLMLASALAGCNGDNSPGSAAGEPAASANMNESGLPIVKTPITLKVWTPMSSNASQFITDYGQNEVYQELEKRTGIHIEFIHPAQGQEKEAFNLMIASGELPDIITGAGRYVGGEEKGVRDGVFEDLTPYLEKYAPDYYKLATSDAETKREVTTDDGKFPAIYMIKPEQDAPFRRIMFREDMLKSVSMDVPKTIDEYEKFFKAIKDSKGIAPYIPVPNGLEEQFMGPLGIVPGFYLKDGKTVAFAQTQPQFKEYLTLMNKWYKEGYINKDFAGLKAAQAQALFDSGKAATFVDAVVGTYNRGKQLKQNYVPAPYPRLKLGDRIHYQPSDWPVPNQGQETVITTSSKHKVEAVRWLNYAFTQEGAMLYNYGIEGKTYTMVDGKPKYTDYILNNPKFGTENANYILRVHFAPKLMFTDVAANPNLAKSPDSAAIRQKWADDPDVDSALQLPPIRLTAEENDKRSKIMTEVNTYSDEMVLKFILGAEPLGNFDNYVNQLKKLGIDEAVNISQAAYDRYLNKK